MSSNYTYQPFVRTRYFGPTNFRGSRVKATNVNTGASITVSWDHALDVAENHMAAALALYVRLPLAFGAEVPESFVMCGTKDQRDYIFTEAPKQIKKDKRR